MWIDTSLDNKLIKYFQRCEIQNLDNVKSVHAFGLGYSYDVDGNRIGDLKLIHHRIFSFQDLEPEYEDFFKEYHRIMVVFKNGGTSAWDFFPSEWARINELLELELSSAE